MSEESDSAGFPFRSGAAGAMPLPGETAGVAAVFAMAARIAFRVLIILIPFRARLVLQPIRIGSIYSDYTDVLLHASDAVALLTLLLWAGGLLAERRKPSFGPWLLSWPLAGLIAASALSAFASAAPAITWMHVARLAGLFALYLYTLNEVESLEELKIPIAVMIGIQAVVAVGQYLVQHSIGLAFLGELVLDPARAGTSIVWAPELLSLRSYGLSDHPNLLGGVLALGLILLVAAYTRTPAEDRIPIFAVALLGLLALLFTFSRAAWLGLAVGAAVFLVWSALRARERVRPLVLLAISAAFVLLPFWFAVAPYLGARFGIGADVRLTDPEYRSPEHRALDERLVLHDAANAMFVENPITGVGLGAFPIALQARDPNFEYDYQPVHFVLLLAAVETGLLGALFYFLAVAFPWVAVWLGRKEAGFRADLAAASAALAGVTVIGLFDYYPWLLAPGRLWHWILWGLWAGFYLRRGRSDA